MQREPVSSLVHLIAALLSVTGLTLLVVFAALESSAWHVVGFSVFGASLILLYVSSALYHFFKPGRAKSVFQRIDHSMIYVLIAGTYTPLCLTVIRGGWGWTLLGIIWGLTVVGIVFKSIGLRIKTWLSTVIYIIMGWIVVIAIAPLRHALPGVGIYWLFAGGMFYTFGTIFFGLDDKVKISKYFGMHELWHIFVMLGSFSHFWLMFKYVL